MDVSDLRRQIIRALDEARKDTAARRVNIDQAEAAYQRFLSDVATPLFLQAATVLRATGQPFTANTPADGLRLVSDHNAEDFIELELDTTAAAPRVIGRTSFTRGRNRVVVGERSLADKAIDTLTEEDVAAFLIEEIRRLVTRT